jgi:uridine phosphorylase
LTGKINLDEGLIKPTKRKNDPVVGPDAILVMIQSDLNYLVKLSQAKKTGRLTMNSFDLYQTKDEAEGSITLSGPFLGAPQAVIGMEKLVALGAERIWVLGWCGSLQPDLKIGNLIIPTGALSEEGTSRHYPIGDRIPATDQELNNKLEEALQKKGQSAFRGIVWTTDAPYRETPRKVEKYKNRGILAVEMEMSALMTLAIYRKVRLAGLLVLSDELFDLEWHSGFSSQKLKESTRFAGELLLELVEGLNG